MRPYKIYKYSLNDNKSNLKNDILNVIEKFNPRYNYNKLIPNQKMSDCCCKKPVKFEVPHFNGFKYVINQKTPDCCCYKKPVKFEVPNVKILKSAMIPRTNYCGCIKDIKIPDVKIPKHVILSGIPNCCRKNNQ